MKGFTKVAIELIQKHPGKTHDEYAKMALDKDPDLSRAINPIFSLASTLAKQVRDGQLENISRKYIEGKYRYFPKTKDQRSEIPATVSLPFFALDRINNLIDLGLSKNKDNAVKLVLEEIKSTLTGYI